MINNVYNIDCMEFMAGCQDKAFDIAIVDPPYGLNPKSTHGRGKLKNRSLNRGNIQKWDFRPPQEYFDELFRVSKNQIIWGGNYFDLPPARCFVCWDKIQVWENFSQCEYAWTSFDKPAKLVRIPNRGGNLDKITWHPTAKPVSLYMYLLKTFANPGDKILDTHMGSQPSRIAAYKMGFDYDGCEIDPEYFKKGCERFNQDCLEETKLPNGTTLTRAKLIFD